MKNLKIRTWYNYEQVPDSKRALRETELTYFVECYNNEGVFPRDLTKPGMVMSIQEIINHHESGRPVPTTQGYFHDPELEPFMPEFNKMTKIDQIQYMRKNRERVNNYYDEKYKADAAAAKEAAAKKESEYNRLKEFESTHKAHQKTDTAIG